MAAGHAAGKAAGRGVGKMAGQVAPGHSDLLMGSNQR